jgi:hypothetical protein
MRTLFTSTLAAIMLLAVPAGAQTVLTFDDIQVCTGIPPLFVYAGVDFNGEFSCYDFPQEPYTAHSGSGRLYDLTSRATFHFLSPTTFSGAWFSGFESATVQFELFLEGVLVGSSTTLRTSRTPTFLDAAYGGPVDAVSVLSNQPDFFVMDDVTFGAPTTVPEPATLLLVATGLLGIAGMVYRRRRRPTLPSCAWSAPARAAAPCHSARCPR